MGLKTDGFVKLFSLICALMDTVVVKIVNDGTGEVFWQNR